MLGKIISAIAVAVTWIVLVAAVVLASIGLAKSAITWLAWRRRETTGGAWFRLPPPVIYLLAWCSGLAIGVAAFMLVHAMAPTHPRLPLAFLILAQIAAVGWAHLVWMDTARRIASLVVPAVPVPSPPPVAVAPGGKMIVILCDGTGNRADAVDASGRAAVTNVCKFYDALTDRASSGWTQVKWYDSGVGTFSSREAGWLQRVSVILGKLGNVLPPEITSMAIRGRNLLELATGMGILENVTQGYAEIVRQYEPGDRIAILGFSRGAYTARVIAGVIARCGLLRSEYVRFAPDVVRLYRYRSSPKDDVTVLRELRYSRSEVPVHFLGLWDTVASLGVPLWGWWFTLGGLWSNEAFDTSPAAVCLDVRHALAIDERRSQFFPTLFEEPAPATESQEKTKTTSRGFTQTIEQAWFRGAHADVGGGYAECALSDVGLDWMVNRATTAGLQFDAAKLAHVTPVHLGDMHDEIERTPGWKYFGSWPRWHPCPREADNVSHGFGFLHDSVYHRAAHARQRRDVRAQALGIDPVDYPLGADELHFLQPNERARVRVRADQVWNRTGLVLEQGRCYRIEAVPGGAWRDKECEPCDGAGQDGHARDLRSRLVWAKRLKSSKWMALGGTLAHPREWPLREKRGRDLFRYLVRADPEELVETLIPLHMAATNGGAYVHVRAMSGVLHCFANDLWAFYDNNSGAIDLDVTCVPEAEGLAHRPLYVVDVDGKVIPQAT